MKFRIAITTDQYNVGDVLAALQEGDAMFEDLTIEAIRPLALPPPASKPAYKTPKKHETIHSRAALSLITAWLIGSNITHFTTGDVKQRLAEANFSTTTAQKIISQLQNKKLIVRDKAFTRGSYLTTNLLKPKKDTADGGDEVL